jgi:hypothetical protein
VLGYLSGGRMNRSETDAKGKLRGRAELMACRATVVECRGAGYVVVSASCVKRALLTDGISSLR